MGVFLGIESGNDTVLTAMNKKARRMDYAIAIPIFKKYGILTFASIFFGFPSETHETARDTMNLIRETKPDFCRPLVWYCDTTTPIWKNKDKYGIKGSSFNWQHNTMTSKIAYDLMEDAFFQLNTPTVYVPDPGFNFISIYYLILRGFTVTQIKHFLTAFNMVIKDKLLHPAQRHASETVRSNMERSCDLTSDMVLDPNLMTNYSGENYINACLYYAETFKDYAGKSIFLKSKNGTGSVLKRLHWGQYSELEMVYHSYSTMTLLSAYLFLIHLLEGKKKIAIVAQFKNGDSMPVCIDFRDHWTFGELEDIVEGEIARSASIHCYSWYLLTNPYRLRQYNCSLPEIHYCFMEHTGTDKYSFNQQLQAHPVILKNILFCLNARVTNLSKLQESYIDYYQEPTAEIDIQYFTRYLRIILLKAASNRNMPLSLITIGNISSPQTDKENPPGKRLFKFN
jgi:hypothetical protein